MGAGDGRRGETGRGCGGALYAVCTMGGEDVSSSGGGEMAERDVGPTMTSLQHQPLPLNQNLSNRPCSSATISCSSSARGTNLAKLDTPDEFPAGMRVLVVDDDPICLMVLERMLHRCNYRGILSFFSCLTVGLDCSQACTTRSWMYGRCCRS